MKEVRQQINEESPYPIYVVLNPSGEFPNDMRYFGSDKNGAETFAKSVDGTILFSSLVGKRRDEEAIYRFENGQRIYESYNNFKVKNPFDILGEYLL